MASTLLLAFSLSFLAYDMVIWVLNLTLSVILIVCGWFLKNWSLPQECHKVKPDCEVLVGGSLELAANFFLFFWQNSQLDLIPCCVRGYSASLCCRASQSSCEFIWPGLPSPLGCWCLMRSAGGFIDVNYTCVNHASPHRRYLLVMCICIDVKLLPLLCSRNSSAGGGSDGEAARMYICESSPMHPPVS